MKVGEFDNALKIRKMIDSFEEDEDVQDVYINSDIDDSLQDQVDKFIDKNTFKT
jgi:vacuolar-type H+-ATPase subunit F/Vma7